MSRKFEYDFSGWATKNDLRCSDGRIIRHDAFRVNDGQRVPLIWNHRHDDPKYVIGFADLVNKPDGVYSYNSLNHSQMANTVRETIAHGDVVSLSIYANQLQQNGNEVIHGNIREVSVVLAGANPGAYIESVLTHADGSDEEAIIYVGEDNCELSIAHSDADDEGDAIEHSDKPEKQEEKGEDKMASEKTVKDVFDTLNEEQKNVVYALIGQALEQQRGAGSDDDNEEDEVKHNAFNNYDNEENTLSHSEIMEIIGDGKRYGSLKESFLQHGITDIDYLFPEDKNMNVPPAWISRDMGWVSKVMSGVHHTPFSRIKSQFADITADAARAKGYTKGKKKIEEVFSLLRRSTSPTTVYKKQKLDRDDVIDITDFDVIAWLKGEMRFMLDEELARAYLIGAGRLLG